MTVQTAKKEFLKMSEKEQKEFLQFALNIWENMKDTQTFDEGMKNDEWTSFEEIRKMGIEMGISDAKLTK